MTTAAKPGGSRLRRRVLLVLACLAGLCCLLLLCGYLNHRACLSREEALLQPPGTVVEVNGHRLHVYTEGSGDGPALVFLSGGGTCSPMLDFKALYTKLSSRYTIAVVEKAGYGFSDPTADTPKDVDSLLSETRQALTLAGLAPPYILCPHSMSGIEALRWAQRYPEEVRAIVGLDMATPQSYEAMEINFAGLHLAAFGMRSGLARFFPSLAESDAILYGGLTETEQAQYRALFYRSTLTPDMVREAEAIRDSAALVGAEGVPAVPMLLFCSNGRGTGYEEQVWRRFQRDFAHSAGAELTELDCPHYVHDHQPQPIADGIVSFLDQLSPLGYRPQG